MRRVLRIVSLSVALGAILLWIALGANAGWTKTSLPVKTIDEITGIEGIQYQKKFVPGLELLGGALLGATLLAGTSIFFPKATNNHVRQTTEYDTNNT